MKDWFSGSIFSLLLWRIVLTTLLFVATIGAIVYLQIDQTLLLLRNRSLENTAEDIFTYLERSDEGLVYLDMPAADRKFYADAGKIQQYVVRGADGQILFTSPVAFSEQYPTELMTGSRFFDFYGPSGTHFLGVSLIKEYEGQTYLIQVAQSESAAESFSDTLTSEFLSRTALYSVPFVIALMLIIYFSLRQSLRPLVEVSRQARRISFQNPDVRLSELKLPLELQPLARAINSALERLESGIKAQQEFMANVAHELRTPLAVLKARVETVNDRETAHELGQDIEEMIHAVNQMLDLSRLDFPEAIKMEEIDASQVVKAICEDMWPLFIKQSRELNVTGTDHILMVLGNRDLIYRALRNLLDNALVHTPEKTMVEVRIEEKSISVWDSGNPIPVSERERVFQRFHRNDREKFKLGAGLGLSIVGKTMKIHGGRVLIEATPDGGGNIFRLQFP